MRNACQVCKLNLEKITREQFSKLRSYLDREIFDEELIKQVVGNKHLHLEYVNVSPAHPTPRANACTVTTRHMLSKGKLAGLDAWLKRYHVFVCLQHRLLQSCTNEICSGLSCIFRVFLCAVAARDFFDVIQLLISPFSAQSCLLSDLSWRRQAIQWQ